MTSKILVSIYNTTSWNISHMGVVRARDRNKNKTPVNIKCVFKDVTQELSGRRTACIHLRSRKYAAGSSEMSKF